jgi:hypothetical protein
MPLDLTKYFQNHPSLQNYNNVKMANSIPSDIGIANPQAVVEPAFTQALEDFGANNTINQFLNAIAQVGVGSTKSKMRAIEHEGRLKSKDLYELEDQINAAVQKDDTFTAEKLKLDYEAKAKELDAYHQETQEELESLRKDAEEGSGLSGFLAGGEKDISKRKISLDHQMMSEYFQKEANSDISDAWTYELPTDLGSSFGTIGTTAANTVMGMFAPKMLKAAGWRGAGKLSGRLLGGAATAALVAGEIALTYYARKEETGAEEDEAYEQAINQLTASYMAKNGITDPAQLELDPKHKRAIDDIKIKAYEQLDGLRTQNMNLGFGDALQTVLAVTPYTKIMNRFQGTTRGWRALSRIGTAALNTSLEMNEEGTQWLLKEQYLNQALSKNDPNIGELSKWGLMSNRFRVERAMFKADDESSLFMNDEFRSAVNAGATAAGAMVTLPNLVSTINDFYSFSRAKATLGRASKEAVNNAYLKYKYDTYAKFIENDRIDYFVSNIRNLAKMEGSGVTPEEAEKEVQRFLKAKKEFDKVNDTQYFGGFIEAFDFRGIAKEDKKKAILNSLVMGELAEQMNDIEAIDQSLQEMDLSGMSKADYIAERKKVLESLNDAEKYKLLQFGGYEDQLTDLSIPVMLKQLAINRLQEENKKIASGKFSQEKKANRKTAKNGTQAQKDALAFKFGNQFFKSNFMTGIDGQAIGEEEYLDKLTELEKTAYLRDNDKRVNVQRMIELGMPASDIVNFILDADAPINQELKDKARESINDSINSKLAEAEKIKDKDGNESKQLILSIDELKDLIEITEIEDPDYSSKLKEVLNEASIINDLYDKLESVQLREPSGFSSDKTAKEITFLRDRFLSEMGNETDKALTDEDYLDDTILTKLEKKLAWLKDVLLDQKDLPNNSDPLWIQVKDYIDVLERDITEAKKLIRERLADKELEQVKSYNEATREVLSGMGIQYTPSDNKDALITTMGSMLGWDTIITLFKDFVEHVAVQDATGKWYVHHAHAEAMLEYVITNHPEVITDKGIKDAHDKLYNDIYLWGKTLFEQTKTSGRSVEDLLPQFLLNLDPESFFTGLMGYVFAEKLDNVEHPITQYITTKDIRILRKITKDDTYLSKVAGTPEEQYDSFQSFVDAILLYKSLKSVLDKSSRDFTKHNIKTQLENEINLFSTLTSYIPTKQQIIALRQLVSWYYNKLDNNTNPLAVVLGYAGSGKTQVVTKLFLRMLGIKNDAVYAFTPSESSNKTLAVALGKTAPTTTDPVKEFLDKPIEQFKDVKLIFLDELGLASRSQLEKIYEKIYVLYDKYGIKTVALGDPTQYSKDPMPAFLKFTDNTSNISKRYLPPLTITYRTDDIDIIRTQKQFRNKSTLVTEIPVSATHDQKAGVVGFRSRQDLYNLLVKNSKDGRNQMVIVNNQTEVGIVKAELATFGLAGVTVLPIEEAQSHTVDEVYVLLTPTQNLAPDNGNYFRFNKAMYVATSRAKHLVAITSSSLRFDSSPKTLIAGEVRQEPTAEERKAFIDDLRDQLEKLTTSNLNTGLAAAAPVVVPPAGATTTTPGTNPIVPNDPNDDPDDNPDGPTSEGDSDVDQNPIVIEEVKGELNDKTEVGTTPELPYTYDPTDHTLKFPQYHSVKGKHATIKVGDKVRYIRYWDTKNNRAGVAVIGQDEKGTWVLLGLIGKDDIAEIGNFALPQQLKDIINDPNFQTQKASDIDVTTTFNLASKVEETRGRLNANMEDNIDSSVLFEAILKKKSPKFFKWGPLRSLVDYLQNAHTKLFNAYHQASANLGIPSKDDLDNWEIKIYNNKEITKNNLDKKVVLAGVPYFVHKVKHASGQEEIIHVPLNTRKLNDEKDKELLEPLQNLLSLIKQLEKYLDLLDGDAKIKWGGLEAVPGKPYSTYTTEAGIEFRRTQAELFIRLLSTNSDVSKQIITELQSKGQDVAIIKSLIGEIRDLLYTPLDFTQYGYDPLGDTINRVDTDVEYVEKYLITGDKNSRRIVPGEVKVGSLMLTEHPKKPGFFLLDKGTQGEQIWRKIYHYKGLHIKIDLPVVEGGKLTNASYQIHSQELMDSKYDGKRIHKNVMNDGTIIVSERIYNHEIPLEDYVEELIDDRLLADKSKPGAAEHAFDMIARANSHVRVGDKKHWIRHTKQQYKDNTMTGRTYFSGLSLMYAPGFQLEVTGQFASYTHKYRPTAGADTQRNIEEVLPEPITSEVLETMIGKSSFDSNGNSKVNGNTEEQGFGLRLPAHSNAVNKRPSESEEQFRQRQRTETVNDFEISLEDIIPTEIVVSTPQAVKPGDQSQAAEDPKEAKIAYIERRREEDHKKYKYDRSKPNPIDIKYDAELAALEEDPKHPNPRPAGDSFITNVIQPGTDSETEEGYIKPGSNEDEDGEFDWSYQGEVVPLRLVSKKAIIATAAKIFGKKWASNPMNIVFLTKEEMIHKLGKEVYGHYSKGVIYLLTDEQGNAYIDVLKHEALHRVLNAYFSKTDRNTIYNLAQRLNPDLLNKRLLHTEEWLAEQYTLWSRDVNNVSKLLWNWFLRIKSALKFHLSNKEQLTLFFSTIEKGNYNYEPVGEQFNAASFDKLRIVQWFGTKENNYEDAANNFTAAQREILKILASKIWPKFYKGNTTNGVHVEIAKNGTYYDVPLSPNEAFDAVFHALNLQKEEKYKDTLPPTWLTALLKDNGKIYKHIFSYLIRGERVDWGKLDDITDELDFTKDPSLKDDIEESFRINYENTLLTEVKNALSTIFVETRDPDSEKVVQRDYIPLSQVFPIMLGLLRGITNFENSDNFYSRLEENYKKFAGNVKVETVSNFIKDLVAKATITKYSVFDRDSSGKIKQVELRNGTFKNVTIQHFLPTNIEVNSESVEIIHEGNITRLGRSEGKNRDKTAGGYIKRMTQMFMANPIPLLMPDGKVVLSNTLSEEHLRNILNTILVRTIAQDTAAGIKSGVMSLTERNPYVGITDLKVEQEEVAIPGEDSSFISETKLRYIPNKILGGEEVVKARLLESILKFIEDPTYHPVLKQINDVLKGLDQISDASVSATLNKVFDLLKLTNFNTTTLNIEQKRIIVNALVPILGYVSDNVNTGKKKISEIKDGLFNDHNGYITQIQDVLSVSEGYVENLKYRDGKGRPIYKWVKSSFLGRTWDTFRRFMDRPGAFKAPEFLRAGVAQKFYYKYNPFLKLEGKRKIREMIVQDSLKVRINRGFMDYEEASTAVGYKHEGISGWVIRNVIFGFVSQLQKSSVDATYIQYPYTPSNKPQLAGYRITVSNQSTLREDILSALKQQVARYKWFEELALKHNQFIEGIPLEAYADEHGIKQVRWTGKLKGGFTERVDRTLPEDSTELNSLITSIIEDMEKSSMEYYQFIKDNNALKANIRNHGNIDHLNASGLNRLVNTTFEKFNLISFSRMKELRKIFDANVTIPSNFETKEAYMKHNDGRTYEQDFNTYVLINESFIQNFVNGHFINQFSMSDTSFYSSPTTQVKRGSGGISPGDTPQVKEDSSGFGMKPKFNIIVAEDESRVFNIFTDVAKAYETLYGIEIDSTDAQMYYLPSWRRELVKGYGKGYNVRNVIKPILYFIDKFGIPRFSKNSGIELTDQLCARFPELKELRADMEKNNIDEYHAVSAFKVGVPANILGKNETISEHLNRFHLNGNALIEVPSSAYGIQLNPASTEGDITNFSQLTYFYNVNNKNREATQAIYEIDALMAEGHFSKWIKKLGKFKKDGFEKNEEAIRKMLIQSIDAIPGNERFSGLLEAKDENGNYLIGLNFPALRGRVEISFMSTAAKNSVKANTGTGFKLVLQAARGVSVFRIAGKVLMYNDLSSVDKAKADKFYTLSKHIQRALQVKAGSYNLNNNSLKNWEENKSMISEYAGLSENDKQFVDEFNINGNVLVPTRLNLISDPTSFNGRVAEVIAPAWWKLYMASKGTNVEEGNIVVVDDFLTRLAFGVRIPSTGIHSAIPFKIVGFTDTKSNIIIAPEELVAIHGSDFDVDSLFMLHIELLTKDNSKILEELKDLDGNVIVSKGQRLGWPVDTEIKSFEEMMFVQGTTSDKLSTSEFDSQLSKVEKLISDIENILDNEPVDDSNRDRIKALKVQLKLANQAYFKLLQNKKNFISMYILLHPKNAKDMTQPIVFDEIKENLFDPKLKIYHPIKDIKVYDSQGNFTEAFLEMLDPSNAHNKIIGKFLAWGITRETASSIKIDVKNNKFEITNKEIRSNIYNDPKISVKLKLQLLWGVLDSESGRNLNNALHNLRYYLENFSGVALTGAFANFVKAIAYINYAAPEGGRFVNKTKNVISVKWDNVVYDKIKQNDDTSKPIWETLDILINGAIDNVKEQVLSLINANNSTGPVLATLVVMGIPLNKIVSLLRQPIIMKEGIKISTFDASTASRKLADIKKDLSKELAKRGIADTREITEEISTEELDRVLGNIGLDFYSSLDKLSTEDVVTQYKAIILYEKIVPVAIQISKAANLANVLRDFPVTPKDMNTLETTFTSLEEYSIIEGASANITDIVHIKTAYDIFKKALEALGTVSPFRSKVLTKDINTFLHNFFGPVKSLSEDDLNLIYRELDTYVLSIATTLDEIDNEWKKPIKIPYPRRNNEEARFRYLVGNDAWVHNFGKYVKEMKAKYPNNEFLRYLEVTQDDNTYKLAWLIGDVMQEPGRAALLEAGFMSLPENAEEGFFQSHLMKYAAVVEGMSFGFRNYSTLISPQIMGRVATFYNDMMEALTKPDVFKNVQEHFVLPFVIRNPSFVKDWFTVPLSEERSLSSTHGRAIFKKNEEFQPLLKLSGLNNNAIDIIVDYNPKKNKKGEFIEQSMPPRFIKLDGNYSSIYYRIESDKDNNIAYYTFVGSTNDKDVKNIYSSNPDILKNKFSLSQALTTDKKVFKVAPNELTSDEITIEFKKLHVEKTPEAGEIVLVRDYLDLYNERAKLYRVDEVSLPNSTPSNFVLNSETKSGERYKTIETYHQNATLKLSAVKEAPKEQRETTADNIGLNAINKLLRRLSQVLKLNYEVADFNNLPLLTELGLNSEIYGFFHNGKVYINSNKLNAETPIHEFGHGLLIMIKSGNKVLYENLKKQILDSPILNEVKQKYPDLSLEDQIDEAIVTAIGRYGLNMTSSFSKGLLNAIKRVFVAIAKLFNIYKPSTISEIDPNTTILQLAEMLLSGNEILANTDNLTGTAELRYMDTSYTLQKEIGTETPDSYIVSTSTGSKILKRVSALLDMLVPYKLTLSREEYAAKSLFRKQNTPETGRVTNPTKENETLSYDEAIQYYKFYYERQRIGGKILHKIIQMLLSPNSPDMSKWNIEKQQLMQDYIANKGNPLDFQWIENNKNYAKNLKERLGLVDTDELHSEFLVYNEEMQLGGTIDLLIKHADNSFSIIDFKSGFLRDDSDRDKIMNYGDSVKMRYNTTNRYQIQLMTYALLLKSKYPNARFRNITIFKLDPKATNLLSVEVDRTASLSVLNNLFRDNPNTVTTNNKYLLDHKEYNAVSQSVSDRIRKQMKNGIADVYAAKEKVLEILLEELYILRSTGGNTGSKARAITEKQLQENPTLRRKLEKLTLEIAELKGEEFGFILDDQEEMGKEEEFTSVGFNVKNRLVKVFIKMRNQALNLIYKQGNEIFNESDALLKPILKKYYEDNGLRRIGAIIGVNMLDYEAIFKFMWKDREDLGTSIVHEGDGEFFSLTPEEQRYNVFYRDTVRDSLFKALSTSRGIKYYQDKLNNVNSDKLIGIYTVEELKDKYTQKLAMFNDMVPVEKWKAELGKYFEYTEDFTPRIPKLSGETKISWSNMKEVKDIVLDGLVGLFTADQSYVNDDDVIVMRQGVPVKYVVNYNAYGNRQSMHTEMIMKLFTKNMLKKQHYDNASAFGQSLAVLLKLDSKKLAHLPNTAGFIDAFIKNNLHDIDLEESKAGEGVNKNLKVRNRPVSLEQSIRSITKAATLGALGFSTIGAGFNLVLNQMVVMKNAVKGSIAKHWIGIEKEAIEFTITDLLFAYKIWMIHVKNVVLGNTDKIKAFDDMYDISQQQFYGASSKSILKIARNRANDTNWAYSTYALGDIVANQLIMIAILNHLQHDGKSYWDNYELVDNKLTWTGGVRGVTTDGEVLTGLSANEMIRLKKVTARLVGEYDKEFKRKMESNALLGIFLTFKKFLPNKLEVAYQGTFSGEFENASLGQYIEMYNHENGEKIIDPEGNPILRWEGVMDRGMVPVTLKVMGDIFTRIGRGFKRAVYLSKAIENDSKQAVTVWSTLSDEQKQHVTMQLLNLVTFAVINLMTLAMYGDIDDDDKNQLNVV